MNNNNKNKKGLKLPAIVDRVHYSESLGRLGGLVTFELKCRISQEEIKVIHRSFILWRDEYLRKATFKNLNGFLQPFGVKLLEKNLKDAKDIANTLFFLTGAKVMVNQIEVDGKPVYELLTTEYIDKKAIECLWEETIRKDFYEKYDRFMLGCDRLAGNIPADYWDDPFREYQNEDICPEWEEIMEEIDETTTANLPHEDPEFMKELEEFNKKFIILPPKEQKNK